MTRSKVVKQENQAEISRLSYVCQLIYCLVSLSSLTTFQLEYEIALTLMLSYAEKQRCYDAYIQIIFKYHFFYNREWLNQHIIEVVNRLFATSTYR